MSMGKCALRLKEFCFANILGGTLLSEKQLHSFLANTNWSLLVKK